MESKEEDLRAAKLALARKKLKDHQKKKFGPSPRVDSIENVSLQENLLQNENNNILTGNVDNSNCENLKSSDILRKSVSNEVDINVTEILISNKRNLENQVTDLESKLSLLKSTYDSEMNSHSATKHQLHHVQSELKQINDQYVSAMDNILKLDKEVTELTALKSSLCDENNNLAEQLELTKAILTTKETENTSIRNNINKLQNELEVTKLQLQQLNSGLNSCSITDSNSYAEQNEILLQQINGLEQQLNVTQKERDQINSHYESYVGELNAQLKSVLLNNDELSKKVQNLTIRESNLIEQIADMEIRLQNIKVRNEEIVEQRPIAAENVINIDVNDLKEQYNRALEELKEAHNKYRELQQLHANSEAKVAELQEIINSNNTHDNISVTKLNADITSDKVAAQRATEQNKKLKASLQELEDAFVKMSQDKLELTEKISAEKYLNRELTIKLAEIEENSKNIHTKLMAKDEEMIRLQATYRNLEKELEQLLPQTITVNEVPFISNHSEENQKDINAENSSEAEEVLPANIINYDSPKENSKIFEETSNIRKEDAMLKLQERFMKIMGEVADLSDEKHRLEHIILQLQNETDTICEYVALYQQQRSLLKKRDEERSTQIQLFQIECDRLKNQLEELSGILVRFAEDEELATYFQVESRQRDMEKVRTLLLNLKRNTLVDPKNNLDLSNVYPCNCCSGNLIDV